MSRKGKSKFRIVGRKEASCKKKPFKLSKTSLLGYSSLGMLGLLTLAMLLPMSSSNTNALDNAMDIAETRVKVKAAASVSLALADQVELDITPSSTGSFASASTRLSVTTNNPEGYKLFLSTKNGNNALLGAAAEISSITSDKTGNEFSQEGDVWGYSLTQGETTADISSTYHQIPTTATLAYDQDTATTVLDEHHYNLSFGVHVTPSLLAGEYSNSVIVSVVANPNTITRLDQLVYMQDMTSAICEATPSAYNHDTGIVDRDSPYYLEPVTRQLYDIRDGNMYWVAKLADGNCWMTQNLALNLGSNPNNGAFGTSGNNANVSYVAKLTPADSDVTEEWVLNYSTNEVLLENKSIAQGELGRSWNFGRQIFATPLQRIVCVNSNIESFDDISSVCAQTGIIDVSGEKWQPTFAAQTGAIKLANGTDYTGYVAVKYRDLDHPEEGGEYDAHFLFGNTYDFGASTARSGDALTTLNADAPESICPRGWQMPVSHVRNYNIPSRFDGLPVAIEKSFYSLLFVYGYPKAEDYSGSFIPAHNFGQDKIGNPAIAPFYYVYNGITHAGDAGAHMGIGDQARIASSTVPDSETAVWLGYIGGQIAPTTSRYRFYGIGVRCLAR